MTNVSLSRSESDLLFYHYTIHWISACKKPSDQRCIRNNKKLILIAVYYLCLFSIYFDYTTFLIGLCVEMCIRKLG